MSIPPTFAPEGNNFYKNSIKNVINILVPRQAMERRRGLLEQAKPKTGAVRSCTARTWSVSEPRNCRRHIVTAARKI